MTNEVYPKALEAFLSATIDMTSTNIKAQLVTGSYSYSSTHIYLSSVSAAALVHTPTALTSGTVAAGYYNANDVVMTSVTTGKTATAVIVYKSTATSASSPLIAHIDTKGDTAPLAIVTNGNSVTLEWSAYGIFRI